MAKVKKKRNKKYTGADAAATRPTITRVQAVNRGKLGQWLFENQKMLKMIRNVLLIGLVIAIIVSGIISLF
jgi:CHASE3 domain sensor protein